MMYFVFFARQPQPEPVDPYDPTPDDDDLFEDRLEAFVDLGFDHLTALALAWKKVSPSEVRERWLKPRNGKCATHEQAAAYFLD